MLSLRLFGGVSLSSSDGVVPVRAMQRRRLALMAVLAGTIGRPVSRDTLVGLLWPEADEERAKHLLADSIYVIRASLGDDVIVLAETASASAPRGSSVTSSSSRVRSRQGTMRRP